MAQAATVDWEQSLAAWLAPFLEALGHKVRQRWAPVYVRGLLGPGERKRVQPMAARVAPADGDQLHHFISSAARLGRPPRSRRCWRARRTALWAVRTRC